MPPKPEFTGTISWGQAIQAGVLIIGFTSGYALLQFQTKAATQALEDAQNERAKLEIRLRVVETQQARADERFSSILSMLARIDGRLERIESR